MGFNSYRACFIIQIAITVCESTRPLNFSLYTSKHTWNEANEVCLKNNKTTLSLKSLSKNNVIRDIATKWTNLSHLVSNFWISLIETNYGEFEWSNCEEVGYSNWDDDGPDGYGMCVGFNITNNKWQTFSCDEEFQVICEEETVVDECWFEEFSEVRFSETDGLIGYGGHSLKTCQDNCLNINSGTTECIMISFENSTGVCRLLEQAAVRFEGTPPSFPSPTFITYVKRCYDYYVSGDEIVTLNRLDYPETNCTEVINVTSSLFSDSSEYITTSIIDYSSVVTTIFDTANQTPMATESILQLPSTAESTTEVTSTSTSEAYSTPTSEVTSTSTSEAYSTPTSEVTSTSTSEAYSTSMSEVTSTSTSEAYTTSTSEAYSTPTSVAYSTSTSEVVPASTTDGIPTSTSEVISTPSSTSESTTSAEISTPSPVVYPIPVVPSSTLCPCKCFATVELDNGTKEAEIIAEIKKELIVNTTTLSSFKRKLYSAEDSRSSVEVVGSIAIGFLGTLLLFVAILDFHHFLRGVQNIFVKYQNREICAAYQPKRVENNIS